MVAPVNAQWADATRAGSDALPDLYDSLRHRWEYGHVAAFVAWLCGFGALQWYALGARRVAH